MSIYKPSFLMLNLINECLKYYLNSQIPKQQAGFVTGRGTRGQITNVRQLIEKCREFDIPAAICFVDYNKAFDCVKLIKLWRILREMGVSEHLVALIESLYTNITAMVKMDEHMSEHFQIHKGVRQGCILSPILFNIYGKYIMRRALENWDGGYQCGRS